MLNVDNINNTKLTLTCQLEKLLKIQTDKFNFNGKLGNDVSQNIRIKVISIKPKDEVNR